MMTLRWVVNGEKCHAGRLGEEEDALRLGGQWRKTPRWAAGGIEEEDDPRNDAVVNGERRHTGRHEGEEEDDPRMGWSMAKDATLDRKGSWSLAARL
jgi:hypothetical protein